MRSTSLPHSSAAVVLLAGAALMLSTAAQAPQSTGTNAPPRIYPAPTNLKVLPKDMTGQQVHEVMEQWVAALGTHCDSCHAEDREEVSADGRPRLNFADDSKPMKRVARTMYLMTEEINTKYVASIDSSGAPVTCGSCHRGHLGPEPFVGPASDPSPGRQNSPAVEKPVSQ